MKALWLILLAVLACGCSNREKFDAAKDALSHCDGPIRARLVLGGWNEHISFECDMPFSALSKKGPKP